MVLARLAPKVPYFCSIVEEVKGAQWSGAPRSPKRRPVVKLLNILKIVLGPACGCAGLVKVGSSRYWPWIFKIKGLDDPKVAVSLKPRRRLRSPRFVRVEGREDEADRGFVLLIWRFV